MDHPYDAITEADLRRRQSAKWRHYPPDVLPAWVAEMDYPLAAPIRAKLIAAIEADDCGYAHPNGLPEASMRNTRPGDSVPASSRCSLSKASVIT